MNFTCAQCETEKDFSECRFWLWPTKGDTLRFCKECRRGRAVVPDVFWDGKQEHGLADDEHGQPRVFLSKGQKAQYLKERGLQEAGDRVKGAPAMFHKEQNKPVNNREQVRKALAEVKKMGRDYRRQEYLRITGRYK